MDEERKTTRLREAEARETAERQLRTQHPVAPLPTCLSKSPQESETLLNEECELDADEEEDEDKQQQLNATATTLAKKPRRRMSGRKLRLRP